MAAGSGRGGGGAGSAGRPVAGDSSRNPYAALNREHTIGREKQARERAALETSRARTQPGQEPGRSPAVVAGNDWGARARAAELIKQTTLRGAWPQMTPSGMVVSTPAQRMAGQGAARPKVAGVEASAAERTQSPALANKTLRVGVAGLWEKPQGTVNADRSAGTTVDLACARASSTIAAVSRDVAGKAAASVPVAPGRVAAVDKAVLEKRSQAVGAATEAAEDIDLGFDGG